MTRDGTIPAEALFEVPKGRERAGDELHDPDNWVRCSHCGLDSPADFENCFDCGEPLTE